MVIIEFSKLSSGSGYTPAVMVAAIGVIVQLIIAFLFQRPMMKKTLIHSKKSFFYDKYQDKLDRLTENIAELCAECRSVYYTWKKFIDEDSSSKEKKQSLLVSVEDKLLIIDKLKFMILFELNRDGSDLASNLEENIGMLVLELDSALNSCNFSLKNNEAFMAAILRVNESSKKMLNDAWINIKKDFMFK